MTAERNFLAFVLSGAIGVSVWLFSSRLTGRVEPWDGNVVAYLAVLFGVGLLAALVFRPRWWMPYLGVLTGQILYALFPVMACPFGSGCDQIGALLPLGLVALLVYSLPTLLGGALVHVARR